jgi:hypothetical protein
MMLLDIALFHISGYQQLRCAGFSMRTDFCHNVVLLDDNRTIFFCDEFAEDAFGDIIVTGRKILKTRNAFAEVASDQGDSRRVGFHEFWTSDLSPTTSTINWKTAKMKVAVFPYRLLDDSKVKPVVGRENLKLGDWPYWFAVAYLN